MTASRQIVIGRVAGVYGVKGWVKVRSYTSPIENFLNYRRCQLSAGANQAGSAATRPVVIDEGRKHGNGLVAHFAGVDDRDAAAGLVGLDVVVSVDELPALDDGDFYWHQLEGLKVLVVSDDGERLLGVVDHLMETGSADVLVIAPTADSIDDRERLIPFQLDVVIKKVDLAAGVVLVDWDPEF